jgi:NADH:ubiquinone oxidoreductase subunit 2 (subunit N)
LKLCVLILLIQCALLLSSADGNGVTQSLAIFSGTYSFNIYTQFAKLIVILGTLALLPFLEYTSLGGRSLANVADLSILFFMNACFACLVISSTHFVLTLLALEGFSLILYIMTTADRTQGGVSASVKYFTFGTLGSILLF